MAEVFFSHSDGYKHLEIAFPDKNGGVVNPEKHKIVYEGCAHYAMRGENKGKWCASVRLVPYSLSDLGEDEQKRLMMERGEVRDIP